MFGKRRLYRLGLCGLAFAMSMQAGCLQYLHPVDPLPVEEVRDNFQVPTACKNGVYVFLLHGIDPFDLANLEGLRDYVQSLGYIKTYYGQPFHAFYCATEIVAIRKRDPNARFVVIGFSYGAGLVRDLACSVGKLGIGIDLLVYLDGVPLDARPLGRPANARKVVNILAFARRDQYKIVGAENLRYDDAWHYGTVTHPKTLRMLVRELAEVALRVPVITDAPPPVPGVPAPQVLPAPKELSAPQVLPAPKELPAPKQLPPPKPNAKRGGWDFLEPDGHARSAQGAKPHDDAFNMEPSSIEQK
jgi:pimeloyl-ACP methyl ester carboxylesterase